MSRPSMKPSVQMPNVRVGRLVVTSLLCLLATAPMHAQIYSWRDANGNLVLSDRPHDGAELKTFAVPKTSNVRVTRSIAARADQYEDLIVGHATLNQVRPDLVRAVIQVESGFNPRAVSPKGALGLMQLMPTTARQLRVRNAFDPEENIRGGVAYLRQLLDRYNGDESLALAAYNAGPGAVDRHGQSVPPFRETQSYVSRISGLVGAAKARRVSSGSTVIYRVVEIVDGHEVVRYTDKKPSQ